jgi:hypothetical protein
MLRQQSRAAAPTTRAAGRSVAKAVAAPRASELRSTVLTPALTPAWSMSRASQPPYSVSAAIRSSAGITPLTCPFTSEAISVGSGFSTIDTSTMRCWIRRCTSHCGRPAMR